ncbi:sensor histidine kinase [Gemmobacter denitrificans]|uniref:histidine kinase n=1 Tax=Gemmobacter denitrificans TaxID=3123040 RepID=A0ABU8BQP0_9RHOB
MDQAEREAMLEAVPLPMVQIGGDLRIVAANPAAAPLLGSLGLGRHFALTFRQPALVEAIEACAAGADLTRLRCGLIVDGQDTVFEVTVNRLPHGGVICCFFDMTEQEAVGQLRRDFVANVSHELRTPLTALLGFIETLQGPARDDAKARERFLGIMAREAERMTRLVRDLLSLSRVEAGERQRPQSMIDLRGLLTSVQATLRPMADAQGVQLELKGAEGALMVRADGDQLTQVFHNLIENAVKYGAPGKLVTVTVSRSMSEPGVRGPALRVEVRDRGEGIDPVHLPRLTERFYRVDTHRSREKGGTGLGLAIVKHIVNRHRGRLVIDSVKGEGSTFSVVLPLS